MSKKKINAPITVETGETLLDEVTSATDGDSFKVEGYSEFSVFLDVTGNTGAVTIDIQVSPDNLNWYSRDTVTYTAENKSLEFAYNNPSKFVRVKTSTQSNSTVSAKLIARGS